MHKNICYENIESKGIIQIRACPSFRKKKYVLDAEFREFLNGTKNLKER